MKKGRLTPSIDAVIATYPNHRYRYKSMNETCPISEQQVNEKVAQVNANLTMLTILLFLTTQSILVLAILAVDFFIRGFKNPAHSYYAAVSKKILSSFKIKPIMVNAGPKIFAAKIGFIFCCLMAVTHLLGFQVVCLVLALIFVFFAALEAISPYPKQRPVAPCVTRPCSARHSVASTCQVSAAARIRRSRTRAPA